MVIIEGCFSVMNYAFDSSIAPAGKTTLVVRYESPWHLWEGISGAEYKAEKEAIQRDATRYLNIIYPGISEHIELVDVATPLTNVRYTGGGLPPSAQSGKRAVQVICKLEKKRFTVPGIGR